MSDVQSSSLRADRADTGTSFGAQLQQRRVIDPDGVGLTVIDIRGMERHLTWAELDNRANQWGRTLAARGAGAGSLVAIAVRNSAEFVLAALGSWKIGAVPVPMRWDLPDWERDRVLATMAAAVVVDQ